MNPFIHPNLPSKPVLRGLIFNQEDGEPPFTAHSRAARYAEEAGFSVGRLHGAKCEPGKAFPPCALMQGFHAVPEWSEVLDKQSIDGAIVGDMRNGPVHLLFYTNPPFLPDLPTKPVVASASHPVSFEAALLQHVGKPVVLRTADGLSYGHGETIWHLADVGADVATLTNGSRRMFFRLAAITHFHPRS